MQTILKRKTWAILIPFFSLSLAIYLIINILDAPIFFLGEKNSNKTLSQAVIAIRDNVSPFEKLGSRIFTIAPLENSYDQAYYFTQTPSDSQKIAFQTALKELLRDYDVVDVFLLSHGNRYINWFEEIPPTSLKKLRLVYNTGCTNANQHARWLKLGADTYLAHQGEHSLSPIFYVYFLRRWLKGVPLEESVQVANDLMKDKITALPLDKWISPYRTQELANQSVAFIFGKTNLQFSR